MNLEREASFRTGPLDVWFSGPVLLVKGGERGKMTAVKVIWK